MKDGRRLFYFEVPGTLKAPKQVNCHVSDCIRALSGNRILYAEDVLNIRILIRKETLLSVEYKLCRYARHPLDINIVMDLGFDDFEIIGHKIGDLFR